MYFMYSESQGISVSIVNRLWAGRAVFSSRQGQWFFLRHRIQTGSGAHPASCSIGNGALSPGVQRPAREAYHSPPSSTKVKNAWSYSSTSPNMSSWHGD